MLDDHTKNGQNSLEDELLEEALSAMDRGELLENILERLRQRVGIAGNSEQGKVMEALVRLAAAIRRLPHPSPHPEQAQAREQLILATGRRLVQSDPHTTPINPRQLRKEEHVWPVGGAPGRGTWDGRDRNTKVARPSSSLIGAMALLLIAAIYLTGLGIWKAGPWNARAARLVDVKGKVETSARGGAWQAAANGERVHSGQSLRTGSASQVTLEFFDGTRTTLDSNSEVTLTQLGGDWGGVLQVALVQSYGKTSHRVLPLRGENSVFSVLTPSGAASVHGTTFDVAVDTRGKSRFSVTDGQLLVSSGQSEIFLTAGQATAILPDGALDLPAYQFSLRGILSTDHGHTWVVSGVPFTVNPETDLSSNPQISAPVLVVGRVLPDGGWIADSVEVLLDNQGEREPVSNFTGNLESLEGTIWQIGGWAVLVDGDTELVEGLAVGMPVRVTFRQLEDGRWVAVRIEALEQPSRVAAEIATVTPDPIQTVTPVATTTITLAAEATLPSPITESVTPTVTVTEVVTTATNLSGCTGADPHPNGERLGQRWRVSYGEIMYWFCQGFGFGEIDLAYTLSRQWTKPVDEIFAMKSGGMGWGEIKKQLDTRPEEPGKPGDTKKPGTARTPQPPRKPGKNNNPGKPDNPGNPHKP